MGDDEMTESEAPDASASHVSANEWDAVKSVGYAAGDTVLGVADAVEGFGMHVVGGVLRGFGADSLADDTQSVADQMQDASAYWFDKAGDNLSRTKDDLTGGGTGGESWVTVASDGIGQEFEAVADAAMPDPSE
jgi:hypothetical protein